MPLHLLLVLCAQAILFLIWIVWVFRWLFDIRADAVARSGQTVPGPSTTWQAFRQGFTAPRYASQRWRLGLLTLPLLALSLLVPFII